MSGLIKNVLSVRFLASIFLTASFVYIHQKEKIEITGGLVANSHTRLMKSQQTGLVAQVLLETTYYSLPSDTLVVIIPKLFNLELQGQLHHNAGRQNVRELVANASLLLSFQDVFFAKILSFLKQIAFSLLRVKENASA